MPAGPGARDAPDMPDHQATTPSAVTTRPTRPARNATLVVGLIATAAFALEMAVSARYGYHRDELYFLAAGNHPSYGYVDQPALTPLAARAATAIFGDSVVGLRVIPALLLAAITAMTAGMSRLLGAGRTGQVAAALATATSTQYLAAAHLMSTTTFDFAFWTLTLLLTVRMLTSSEPRWWLAIGASVGIGLDAKWGIAVLAVALAAGIALTPQRHLLRSRYLLIAAALAIILGCPDVIWQATHGWPNLAVFQTLHGQSGHNMIVYWPAQVLYTGVALTPLWVRGLIWCLRDPAGRAHRAIAIAAMLAIAAFFVAGGKPYYPGGAYTFLFAAGAVPLERLLHGRPARRRSLAGSLGLSFALSVPIALPILPAATLHTVPLQKINYDLGETIGWPQQVALIAREYRALPAADRATTTLLAGNYGEAGALARYGRPDGLPVAYSGANNFWYWGPPPASDRAAIAVNIAPALLHRIFSHVRQIATFHNGLGVADDEQGVAIYLATGRTRPWRVAWPLLRDFS
jgi:hypothetical protein